MVDPRATSHLQVISFLLDHNYLLTALELLHEAGEAGGLPCRCRHAPALVLLLRLPGRCWSAARRRPEMSCPAQVCMRRRRT